MAREKGLTVIVDSRKSAPSELCLSALKLYKVSQCRDGVCGPVGVLYVF